MRARGWWVRLLFPKIVRIFYSAFPTPYAYYSFKLTHYSQNFTYYSAWKMKQLLYRTDISTRSSSRTNSNEVYRLTETEESRFVTARSASVISCSKHYFMRSDLYMFPISSSLSLSLLPYFSPLPSWVTARHCDNLLSPSIPPYFFLLFLTPYSLFLLQGAQLLLKVINNEKSVLLQKMIVILTQNIVNSKMYHYLSCMFC